MMDASQTLYGLKIHVLPDIPRYQLPEEIIPGLPWPTEYRQEVNQWARRVCGTTSIIPDGQMLIMEHDQKIFMRHGDYMDFMKYTRRMKP